MEYGIYYIRLNHDKSMLYVKYATPKEGKIDKLTCVTIAASGKINF